jgi:Outer membrane protein beta-barrel domain
MRFLRILVIGLTLSAGTLEAQHLGLGGGVSLPQGDLGDGTDHGWYALASFMFGSPMQPVGLRIDAAHARFPFAGAVDGHSGVSSATVNLSYRIPRATWQISPYLIAGLGAYRTSCSNDAVCEGQVRYGWNAGLGFQLRLLGLQAFLEGRFHRTTLRGEGVHFFPVTLGFRL